MTKASTRNTQESPLIVGVGASAGGLEAFQELLASLGDATNLAIVFIVQHPQSSSESLLAERLNYATTMSIVGLSGRKKLEPHTLYLSTSHAQLELRNGFVSVSAESEDVATGVIDHFLYSLAEDQGERGIGLILSGLGSDGTLGLKAIREQGGITFAQSEKSAKFGSMPRSAAINGVADYVLNPSEIAKQLQAYSKHLHTLSGASSESNQKKRIQDAIPLITRTLINTTQHDFRHCKSNHLVRRIQRRMQVLRIDSVANYVSHVQRAEDECQALFRELLIAVTSFFCDPGACAALQKHVLPKLFARRSAGETVHVWVAGCATGAEAYTMAILCQEVLDDIINPCKVQIFATDIDERALRLARAGTYPYEIERSISPERLKRFFVRGGKKYQVTSEIRDLVVFSKHNVISDPPVCCQDLISCRNLLINLDPHLQSKLMSLFHYALRPGGYLFHGPSENITSDGESFLAVDSGQRISQLTDIALGSIATTVHEKGRGMVTVAAQMETELEKTRNDLDRSILDMEAVNVELKASNDELLSVNVQLQSANVEREMSNEKIRVASNAVAQANSDLENLLRSSHIATVVLDDELCIRSFTPAIRDIYELLPTDIGRPLERFAPLVTDMPRLPDPKTVKSSELSESTVLAHSGKSYIRRIFPYHSHTGGINGIVVSFADVSELRKSEQQFHATFFNAAVGIAHIALSGEWLRVNDRLCEIMGYTREELLNRTSPSMTHLDDVQPDLQHLERLVAGEINTYTIEKRYLRLSGEPFWINLTVSLSHDASGRPDYSISVIEDIDEQVRQRSTVLENERNWRLAVEIAQLGVVRIDYLKDIIIADTRAAHLFGVAAVTPMTRDEFHTRIHPDDRQRIEALIAASMAPDSDGRLAAELRVLTPDGTLHWLNVRKQNFFRDIGGHRCATHGVLAAIDITEKNEAALELAEAKQQSDLAMATGRLGEWKWDVKGDVVTWGDSLINLLGYKSSNAPGNLQEFVATIHRHDRAATQQVIQTALQGSSRDYQTEFRMLRADGSVVWIEGRGLIHRSSDGQPLSIVGMASDITERKIAELKLADRELHLRRVIDGSLGFLVVLSVDGTLLELNAPARKSIDAKREDLIGQKFWDCYWWNFDPDLQAQVRKMVEQAAQGEVVRQDIPFRVAHDQRRIADAALSPVFDEGGTISHVVGSSIDITDRVAVEAAASEREQRLRLALEAGQMGTYVSYLDSGELIWSDPAYAIMGVENTGQALTDEDLLRIVHPDDRESLRTSQVQALRAGNADASFEFRVIRPADGRTAWVSGRGTIERDTNGIARQISGVIIDITTRKRAELDSVQRESELRRILDNVVGLVGVLDRHGVLLEANEAALQIGGVRREDVIGKPFWDCYWWNFDAIVVKRLRASFERAMQGELVRYDAEVRTAGEGRAIIDFMLAPIIDADGTITHLIPSAVDVTQRRKTEHELADSRAQLATAMEAAQMGSFQWEPETDVADWDDAWIRTMGIAADAPKVGQTLFDLIHPEDRAALEAVIPPPSDESQPYYSEFRIIRPDGKVRWFVGNGILRPASDGQPARLVGLNWDITDTKLAEERIRQGEERLRLAMGAAGLSLWEWDIKADRISWDNDLYLQQGMQPPDSMGGREDFLAIVHDDDRDNVCEKLETTLTQGTPYRVEFRMRQTDGNYRWVLSMGHLNLDLAGRPDALVGVEMDVTDRHDYENELRKARHMAEAANNSKSEFVANMSHEIRTPMTAVLGYADLLFAQEEDPEKLEHLRTIKRNGNFLLDIINDILDLSMIEAGKMTIERESFSPSELVADVHSMMQVRASEKDLQFDVEYDGPVPSHIKSDPRRLKQILVNLIGNAIKFTATGSVRITVHLTGLGSECLRFEIADSGIGMSEEQQLKLFQPFAQGDNSISRQFGGTGLGLAISRRLAGMLGGDISVVSRSGEGSVFAFTIATGEIDASSLIDPTTDLTFDMTMDTTDQGIHLDASILVIDDQSDIRALVRHILTAAGANVEEAEDGEAGVKVIMNALSGEQPLTDLILLDMQMPRLDGYGTVEKLRKLGFQNPVIALTANAMRSDMDRCLASGCDAYLSKPINSSTLLQKVEQLLNTQSEPEIERQCVLIVDDSVDTVRLLKRVLEKDGHVIASAHTGDEAITIARKIHPQTVIVDLTLPDMTGYDVLESLRTMPHLSETLFLALTGHIDESDVRRCLEAGFHQHVAKPVDIASLREVLKTKAITA